MSSFIVLCLLALPVCAQDSAADRAVRAVELPTHRALLALRRNPDTTLAPFTTDGCSGGLSGAWGVVANQFPEFAEIHQSAPPWEPCCVTHDRAYHVGGGAVDAAESYAARLTSDQDLRACVIETGALRADELAALYQLTPEQIAIAYQSIGEAMFLAVRLGGAPCSGLPWRWGYGYPSCSVLSVITD